MFCTKCGSPLEQDSKFCTNCGAPIETKQEGIEENSGRLENEISSGVSPMQSELNKIDFSEPLKETEILTDNTPAIAETKKGGRKWIIIGAIAAAVVILAVVLIVVLSKGGSGSSSLAYRKGEDLMLYSLGSEPFIVSDDFGYQCYAQLDEDTASMYYVDSYEYNDSGYFSFKLYYRDISNEKSKLNDADEEKGVLVGKNVYTFRGVDGTLVYLRDMSDEGGKLRAYYKGEEISLDSGVKDFYFSDDGKKVVYLKNNDGDNDLYEVFLSDPDNSEKIASDVYTIMYYPEENTYESYIYLKETDDAVYSVYMVRNGESAKLLSDVTEGDWIDDQMFFLQAQETEISLEDVVIDDMPEDDYDAQYIREDAENYPYTYYSYNLYLIEDYEAVPVVEGINGVMGGNGYIVYSVSQLPEGNKPKLSELIDDGYYYWDDIYYDFYAYESENTVYAMKIGGEPYQVFSEEDMDELLNIDYDANSGYLYWLDVYDSEDGGELVCALVGEDKLGESKTIDKDVNYFNFGLDGEMYYVKYEINEEGTAYCFNGKESVKIADDVYYVYALKEMNDEEQSGIVLVWTDYDGESATLSVFNGKELIKLDDDVYYYSAVFKGENMGLFYLKDYSYDREEGELRRWDMKNNSEKIDDDVSEIVA